MSDGRKKLSGAQYKRKREIKQVEAEKQADSLFKYLHRTKKEDDDSELSETAPDGEATNTNFGQVEPTPGTSKEQDADTTSNAPTLVNSDPASWPPYLTEADRCFLVRKGPPQPLKEFSFPYNETGRRFTGVHYFRNMKNGEKVIRNWLVYSITKNCIYCFCCKLFGSSDRCLSSEGFKDWKHLAEALKEHEVSKNHIQNLKSWIEFSQRLQSNKTIDSHSQRLMNAEINHWSEVLLRIVSTIKMLAQNCLALRGRSDKLYDFGNGNFLQIIQLLAQFDPVMEEHIRRILKKEVVKVHYLGKDIQNELIGLLRETINCYIIGEIKRAKYYSIILDCTPDVSKIEQMTVLVRYVSIDKSNPNEIIVNINERFLGFLPVERSTGQELSTLIIQKLEKLGLDLQDMRGQAYDNGANMRGDKSGVQSRIKALNRRAFYVPCSGHSLNLVVNDMAKASFEAANFFNMVHKIYLFFSSSTFRWAILMKYIQGLTLKPVCDTRWESRIDAIKPLRYNLGGIYDALLAIYNNKEIDNSIRVEASGLLNCLKQFKFLCSIVIWYKILNCINPISKLLQTKDYDLPSAIELLNNCKHFFENLRSDTAFDEMLCNARELADEIDIPANFELTEPRHRVRKRNNNFDYEARDDPIEDPTLKYKVEFYFFTLDQAINALESRFHLMSTHSDYFQFLYNIYDLKETPQNELLKYCKDLEILLSDGNSSDISALELADEITSVLALLNKKESVIDLLKIIAKLNLAPNLAISLRILLSLPISVASGERSFSKLKIIKNFLRSTTTEDRLNGLSTLAIEHELADKIDIKKIIKDFSELKVRKKHF